jgi:hypothetical protein
MEEKDFHEKYWFDNMKIITVVNPLTEEYKLNTVVVVGIDVATGKQREESRTYRVPAGGHERFPGSIANQYLDQVSRLVAQNDGQFANFIDFRLRAQYYDDLIVKVEDILNSYQPYPDYLRKEENVEPAAPAEQPFAQLTEENNNGNDTTGATGVGTPAQAGSGEVAHNQQ